MRQEPTERGRREEVTAPDHAGPCDHGKALAFILREMGHSVFLAQEKCDLGVSRGTAYELGVGTPMKRLL